MKALLNLILFIVSLTGIQSVFAQDVLETEFVFELRVLLEPAIVLGETRDGVRQAIPIIGGSFEGPAIRGEILSGGADYQLERPDGVRELEAVYMIKTDDGALINVVNEGIIVTPESSGDAPYIMTTPRFWAPLGKYDWLNKSVFLSRIVGGSDDPPAVFIRVYRVK